MHTIDKTIDGKPVSFWLDDCFVRASIGETVIGDVAAAIQVPGFVKLLWSRGRNWELFAAAMLDPIPSQASPDETADIRIQLFEIVISVAKQLRKEAA